MSLPGPIQRYHFEPILNWWHSPLNGPICKTFNHLKLSYLDSQDPGLKFPLGKVSNLIYEMNLMYQFFQKKLSEYQL